MYSDPQSGMGLRARAVNGPHAPPSVSNVEFCLQMFDMGVYFFYGLIKCTFIPVLF